MSQSLRDDDSVVVVDQGLQTSTSTGRKLTYDDFVRFPDDGRRHELIDGKHYVSPSPVTKHQRVSKRLFLALNAHLEQTRAGEAFYAPFDVVLGMFDVVEPDLLVVLADQASIVTPKHVVGAPAIVVEIVSAGTRRTDERQKLALYERAGVREYWLVDIDRERLRVFARTNRWFSSRRGRSTTVFTSRLLPGLEIDLRALFA